MNLKGKVALVTGANRGLGVDIVRELLDAGVAKIYATSRDVGKLDTTLALDLARVVPLRLDITNQAEIVAAVAAAGDVQLLVNNAGVLDFAGAMDTTQELLERNMGTNFYGTFDISRAFVPVLEKNGGGTIVNVLSVLAFVSAPIFAAYNASKAASWLMAMSLRPYVEPLGISIVNVFPTTIETEMVEGLDKVKAKPADVARDIVLGIANGDEDIYPVGAAKFYADWRADQKAVEKYYAGLT